MNNVRIKPQEVIAAAFWDYSEFGEYPTWEEISTPSEECYDEDTVRSYLSRADYVLARLRAEGYDICDTE